MLLPQIYEECLVKGLTPSKKDKIVQVIYQVHGDKGLHQPNAYQVLSYVKTLQTMLAYRVEIFTCDACETLVHFHPKATQRGIGEYDDGIGLCEMCV